MADVKITELPVDSSVTGTETVVAVDGGTTTKSITTALLAAYAIDTLQAAAAATPTTGDDVVAFRGTTEKLFDLDDLAEYCVGSGWDNASEADPAVTGDMLLIERSGTIYQVDVDTLTTYALTGVQASVLDISGLSTATLGATDQFLAVQGSTAKKTTLSAIETKLWADYLAYVDAQSASSATVDGDQFWTIQGGVLKTTAASVLATYMLAEVGTGLIAAAYDATLADSVEATDVLIAEKSDVPKTVTALQMSTYVLSVLAATGAGTPTTGDDFLYYTGSTAKKGDIDDLASYVLATAWTAPTTVTSLSDGDYVHVGQSGTSKKITVANLGIDLRPDVLNFSGLDAATLGGTDQILVCQTTTAKKTTLADLETKLVADELTRIAALTAVATTAGTDVFRCYQGGTEKKVTPAELAVYMTATCAADILGGAFDAADAAPAASTDLLLMERSGTRGTIDVGDVSAYVIDDLIDSTAIAGYVTGDKMLLARGTDEKTGTIDLVTDFVLVDMWAEASAATVTSLVAGDVMLLGRSTVPKQITVANMATGIQSTVLNISGLSSATLDATDTLLVCESTTAKKATVAELETLLWADFRTYTVGLSAVTVATDSDKFWVDQGGTAKYMTASVLATYMLAEIGSDLLATAWDAAAVTDTQATDVFILERSNVLKTVNASYIAAYSLSTLAASAAAGALAAGNDFLVYQSGTPKMADIDDVALYNANAIWTSGSIATVTTLNDSDTIHVGVSDVSKNITVANLQTHILTGIQATVLNIDSLDAATLAAGDKLHIDQSGVAKSATITALETLLWADYATYVHALTDITTIADNDEFYVLDAGTTAKRCTATELATYVTAELWDASTGLGALTGTDTILTNRSGTMYESTLTELTTLMGTGLQATILNISGLDAATIASTDYVLICQSTTAKQATVGDLSDEAHDTFAAYTTALDAVTDPSDTDVLYILDGGTAKKITVGTLSDKIVDDCITVPWATVAPANYTQTPPSTSTITFSDTTGMEVGLPLAYTWNGTVYYGIITAVSANALVTVAGATLDLGWPITDIKVGTPEMVEVVTFTADTPWASTAQDILADVQEYYFRWRKSNAYLVSFGATQYFADTGAAQPKVNVKIGGNLVSTDDSSKGLQLSDSAGTWVDNDAVEIDTSNYAIEWGDAIEIRCTEAGTNGDAGSLTLTCVFVHE